MTAGGDLGWLRDEWVRVGAAWALAVLVAWIADFVARGIIVRAVRHVIGRTKATWDDVLVEHGVFERLSQVAPALVFYSAADLLVPAAYAQYAGTVRGLANAWMVLAGARATSAFLDALVTLGARHEGTRDKPVKSYVQVAKIVLWLAVGIVVVSTLMHKSPWALLTGLGAMTAILLLVFKDSILGFVASVQIASSDMLRPGDWVEMPRYGADGDVVDIGLHTVKVQNWDKTISTIPTYAFITESFKNWRGMSESGGRRIKRSLAIDMTSVRFLDGEDLARLRKVQAIADILDARVKEVEAWNERHAVDPSSPANGRRLTNLGTFRAYVEAYLRGHPQIHPDMTFLVRQLPPGPEGIPLEIYVFSAEQRWAHYEGIQSDLFDHLLAVLPEFGLRVYQRPSGADVRAWAATATGRD